MCIGNFERVEIGPAGIEYFLEQLITFETPLIRSVAESKPEILETFAFLPRDISLDPPISLECSIGTSLQGAMPTLVDFIDEYLRQGLDNVFIMENPDIPRGWILSSKYVYKSRIYYNDGVPLHVAVNGDSKERIKSTLVDSETQRYHFGILSVGSIGLASNQRDCIEPGCLAKLVKAARYLITIAWDTEGYVLARVAQRSRPENGDTHDR